MKKAMTFAAVCLFCVGLVDAQSLVELSKKEKVRRAKLKGKKCIVLTAKKIKKNRMGSLIISRGSSSSGIEKAGADTAAEQEKSLPRKIIPTVRKNQEQQDKKESQGKAQIEDQWKKANEYVQLLTLKMNALWQDFYSMDDMKSRDEIQRQISDTFKKLQAAQQDEKKLKAQLDAFKK